MPVSKTSIVVLETHTGEDLVIFCGPSNDTIHHFVKKHHERFKHGRPGGPAGQPAFGILSARRYSNEPAWLYKTEEGWPIDITKDLL